MSKRREWEVSLTLTCHRCGRGDQAAVGSTSCEDARQNAMKVLRYRGWSVAGKQKPLDLCPKCAPPLPTCEVCSEPTPSEYAHDSQHVTGVRFACPGCFRIKFEERMHEWRTRREEDRE